jgi:hypothetical protein
MIDARGENIYMREVRAAIILGLTWAFVLISMDFIADITDTLGGLRFAGPQLDF